MDNNEFDELLRIQRLVTDRLSVEARMDRKIKLLDLISSMTSGKDNSVQKEVVLIEAQAEGFTEQEIDSLLQELQSDNLIIQSDGKILLS